jgi:hypothetical protein
MNFDILKSQKFIAPQQKGTLTFIGMTSKQTSNKDGLAVNRARRTSGQGAAICLARG